MKWKLKEWITTFLMKDARKEKYTSVLMICPDLVLRSDNLPGTLRDRRNEIIYTASDHL